MTNKIEIGLEETTAAASRSALKALDAEVAQARRGGKPQQLWIGVPSRQAARDLAAALRKAMPAYHTAKNEGPAPAVFCAVSGPWSTHEGERVIVTVSPAPAGD